MTLATLFSAIAGAIKAVPIIDSWLRMLVAAWMDGQTNQTLGAISDAAAFAAKADSDELRYQASAKWQKALQRPRVLP